MIYRYPCSFFLHNALRFISQNKSEVAYEEICHAIKRSGGELTEEEKEHLKALKKQSVPKESTCKDCLHYEICSYNTYQEARYFGKDTKIYITIDNHITCKFFRSVADVTDVRHGRWIKVGFGITERVVCSVCKSQDGAFGQPLFCSDCGAIMDKRSEGSAETKENL